MKEILITLWLLISSACAHFHTGTIPADEGATVVWVYGRITKHSYDVPRAVLRATPFGGRVVIHIHSPGGMVAPSNLFISDMVYADLRGVKIICVVDGMALSSAFFMLQGCPERAVRPWSVLMMHKLAVGDNDGIPVPEETWTDAERAIVKMLDEQMAAFIAGRMGMPVELYKAQVEKGDWYMNAAEAIANGAADKILP